MIYFSELLAKSCFSFLRGASQPEEMIQRAKALGYEALALVDIEGFYGSVRAHAAAKECGLKLLHGAEILTDQGQRLALIAQDREGYGDLCELLTQLHSQRDGSREQRKTACPIAIERVLEKSSRLFALLPAHSAPESGLSQLKEAFGSRLYLVASRFRDGFDRARWLDADRLARAYDARVIASNEPLFHEASRKPLHDVLACILHGCRIEEGGRRLLPNAERYLKSKQEMATLFASRPQWLSHTRDIVDSCQFSMDELSYRYPMEWIPAGETSDSYLERLVRERAARKGAEEALLRQLDHELALVKDLQYADYFLTVYDIIHFAQSRGILCQGRGSAANSVICYLLGVTAVDPLKQQLLFERFLSRERREPPDIDIDFEHERREEVIQYIYARYGRHRAAITAEVICYRSRSALRDVAKVFSVETTSVEKLLTFTHRRDTAPLSFADFAEQLPEVGERRLRSWLAFSQALRNFPRHLGTHVGGFVLSQSALNRCVPVEKAAMEDRTIVQWDKNDLDALGFVRVDILGLGILTCIRKCLDLMKRHHRVEHTLASVSENRDSEPRVYEAICRSDTIGVFQIESRAQMNMLPRLKPKDFFDLVVEISLVRPGPIQGQMVHPYLRRRAGLEVPAYAHPELESILKKTLGVPLFQEQVMKIAIQVAGFTPGEADELRRAMGTWRRDGNQRLHKMGEKFRQGLVAKGIEPEYADRVFSQIEGFAEYGFPESHAASFAVLVYATAFLHHYFPDAYLAAMLNSQPMGFYAAHSLIQDGIRHGVTPRPVDVQKSDWDNELEPDGERFALRMGFREIKGLPRQVGEAIALARKESPFRDLSDLIDRTQAHLGRPQAHLREKALTKRDLFLLAGAHALEGVGLARRQALWEIQSAPLQESRAFFPSEAAALPEEERWESISLDFEAQGISLLQHPLGFLRTELSHRGIVDSRQLARLPHQRRARVAGMVICRQMPPTASGVLFITLEDEEGLCNLVIWRATYEKYRECLLTQSFLFCEGKVQRASDGNVVHLIVEHAEPLLSPTRLVPEASSHDFH